MDDFKCSLGKLAQSSFPWSRGLRNLKWVNTLLSSSCVQLCFQDVCLVTWLLFYRRHQVLFIFYVTVNDEILNLLILMILIWKNRRQGKLSWMALIVNIKEGRPGSEWMRRVWQFEIGGYDLWRAEDEAIQVILFHFDLLLHLGVEGSGSLEKRRVNAYRVVAHNKYNTCTRPTI